jgi:uncharacterized oxidoreductase
MQLRGNTVFITGGTSGIGRGLAEAFHQRGNQVIISGRREDRLKEMCRKHSGMRWLVMGVTDPEAIRDTARRAIAEFPDLNCVVNNAGVQMGVDFTPGGPLDEQKLLTEVSTNLLGPIRVTAAFLPHLVSAPGATVINVSSGLGFVPMARFPVYCATKAAVHSWTMSLRHQLRQAGVKVVEIIPPWVATELGSPGKAAEPVTSGRGPIPLDTFIAETMAGLESGEDEVAVGSAKNLVAAAGSETFKHVFANMNR